MTEKYDLNEILTDQERILVAAWMLPNTGDLTEPQRRQAMDNFTKYIRARGLTPSDVARRKIQGPEPDDTIGFRTVIRIPADPIIGIND